MPRTACRSGSTRRVRRSPGATLLPLLVLLGAGLGPCRPDAARALDHSGNIGVDETWFAADSPHVVSSTVSILAGATLTIEAGATVSLGGDQGLVIQGALQAVGAPGAPIRFARQNPGNWNSLQFAGSGAGTLSWCQLEYANNGVQQVGTGTVSVSHCTIDHGHYGLYATSGSLEVGSTTITACINCGIYGSIAPTFTDDDVLVDYCATGVYLSGIAGLQLTAGLTISSTWTVGLHLANCEDPSLDNLVLTGNTGSLGAQYYENCGDVWLGPASTVGGIAGQANTWGLCLGAGSYLVAGSTVPAAGNRNSGIRLSGGTSTHSGTLRSFYGTAYVVDGPYVVAPATTLTIEPGSTVRLGSGRSIMVEGTLRAIGAPGAEIQFTPQTAYNWQSLQFVAAGGGTLEYCHLANSVYCVYLAGTGGVTVNNCVIDHALYGLRATGGSLHLGGTLVSNCSNYGLHATIAPVLTDGNVYFYNCATGVYLAGVAGLDLTAGLAVWNSTTAGLQLVDCPDPTLDHLVLTGNTGSLGAQHYENCGEVALGSHCTVGGAGALANLWGVSLGAGSFLAAGSTVPTSGNTNNDIRLGSVTAGARSGTLRKFDGAAYAVDNPYTVGAGTTLVIEPGTTIKLGGNRSLAVQGTLQAVGLPGAEIVFTRRTATAWNSLQFSAGGTGTLEHCRIELAYYGLYCNSTGTVTVRDCELSRNGYGLAGWAGTAIFRNTRIVANTLYGVYLAGLTAVFGDDFTQWNDIHDNGSGSPGRDLRNGTTDLDARWVYWGTLNRSLIAAHILDDHDDRSLGEVFFEPCSNETHDDIATDVPGEGVAPAPPVAFGIAQNHPNPFNPSTVIGFALPRAAVIRLTVHDLAGARVATLVDGPRAAGRHEVTWRGTDDCGCAQASGAYFYRLESPDGVLTRRMMLVR